MASTYDGNDNYVEEYSEDPSGKNGLIEEKTHTLQQISSTIDSVQKLYSMYNQAREIEAKTEQMRYWSDVKITEITAKYKSCQDFLEKSFGERETALDKHYKLLDDAIEKGDRELIIHALHGISGIVTTSPLSDFEKFVELYNDTSKPLLDF